MKQWFFIISGSLLAIALTAALLFAKLQMDKKAQASTSPTVTSGLAGTQVSFEGTSFTIPPDLGSRTLNEYIPASNPGTVVDILAIYPGHRRSILEDYPLRDTSSQPQILIFPAPEFAQMSDCSKATIDGLKKILAAQHISPVMPDTCVSDTDMLPFLPDQYAKQIFRAQEKFLSFRNGTGIRYITQYGLAAFPAVNNMDIFYTFQGLTSDGKYYVSVILPVNLPDLAAEDDPEAFKHPADWQNPEKYPDYLATMLEKLDQEDNPFSPSLESLDALSQSLLVTDQQ